VLAFLENPEVRRAILRWVPGDHGLGPSSGVYISEGTIQVFCYLRLTKPDQLKRGLEVASKFANELDEAREQPSA
jgi:hypothetical protein